MGKTVTLSVELAVGDSVKEPRLLEMVERALGSLLTDRKLEPGTTVDLGKVSIKSGPKITDPLGAGGYESKLWEKATCCISMPENPEEWVSLPKITQVRPNDLVVTGVEKIRIGRAGMRSKPRRKGNR